MKMNDIQENNNTQESIEGFEVCYKLLFPIFRFPYSGKFWDNRDTVQKYFETIMNKVWAIPEIQEMFKNYSDFWDRWDFSYDGMLISEIREEYEYEDEMEENK